MWVSRKEINNLRKEISILKKKIEALPKDQSLNVVHSGLLIFRGSNEGMGGTGGGGAGNSLRSDTYGGSTKIQGGQKR